MGQTDRQHLCINLDLIAVEGWAPIDILCAENHWLLIHAVLEDCHVNRLIQLKKHCWVELDFLIIAYKLKQECLVENWVARRRDDLCAVTILQERNCHR